MKVLIASISHFQGQQVVGETIFGKGNKTFPPLPSLIIISFCPNGQPIVAPNQTIQKKELIV